MLESTKSIVFVSHDRELLSRTAQHLVTVESDGAWLHAGPFATYGEARVRRVENLEEDFRRFQEQRQALVDTMKQYKRWAASSPKFASRAKASETRLRHFDESQRGSRSSRRAAGEYAPGRRPVGHDRPQGEALDHPGPAQAVRLRGQIWPAPGDRRSERVGQEPPPATHRRPAGAATPASSSSGLGSRSAIFRKRTTRRRCWARRSWRCAGMRGWSADRRWPRCGATSWNAAGTSASTSCRAGQQARLQILLLEARRLDAPGARRAHRQPRRRVGRGARAGARGVRRHRHGRFARPLVSARFRPVHRGRQRRQCARAATRRVTRRRDVSEPVRGGALRRPRPGGRDRARSSVRRRCP